MTRTAFVIVSGSNPSRSSIALTILRMQTKSRSQFNSNVSNMTAFL